MLFSTERKDTKAARTHAPLDDCNEPFKHIQLAHAYMHTVRGDAGVREGRVSIAGHRDDALGRVRGFVANSETEMAKLHLKWARKKERKRERERERERRGRRPCVHITYRQVIAALLFDGVAAEHKENAQNFVDCRVGLIDMSVW
jgi:hypothetical protein